MGNMTFKPIQTLTGEGGNLFGASVAIQDSL